MFIEATRRFTVLSSHLNPTRLASDQRPFHLSGSVCSSGSDSETRLGDIKNQNWIHDCVFCNIIRGQSHAVKVVAAMCSKVPFISNAIMKATGCNAFNLLVNNGADAGQTHIHIIPRKAYDCLWDSESLLRRPLKLDDEKVSQLAACIQEQLLASDISQDSKNEDFCSSKS
ncbi:variant 2, Histidine triad nucleotide-binding protein 3 [Lathyrus oleraceus]|uniref:Variant 2, Histidine triad nucleotide-binding protein 3 n=1 Tax=Pisum sativum TaxID=3888 RepID=A0A9D4XZB1_PEA|nr:variant 2, Histidine triad nucleotide-binding protein 3 [Pisum sativum]